MSYESIEERIRKLQESLDGSYKALSGRLSRLELREQAVCESVSVTFSREEAEKLLEKIKWDPDLFQQKWKLTEAMGENV